MLTEDEQARMTVEDVATQDRDREEEESLRLEEEEVDKERERKTMHGVGAIRTVGDVGSSTRCIIKQNL